MTLKERIKRIPIENGILLLMAAWFLFPYPIKIGKLSGTLMTPLMYLLFILWLWQVALGRKIPRSIWRFVICASIFFFSNVISLINTSSIEQSLIGIRGIGNGIILAFLVAALLDDRTLRKYIILLYLVAASASCLGILQFYVGKEWYPSTHFYLKEGYKLPFNATGFAYLPTTLGLFYTVSIPLFFGLLIHYRFSRKLRNVFYPVLLLSGFGLILTFSRGAWLGVILGVGLVAIRMRKIKQGLILALIVITMIFFVSLEKTPPAHRWYTAREKLFAKLFMPLPESQVSRDHPSLNFRIGAAIASFRMIRQHPLIGHGARGFQHHYKEFSPNQDALRFPGTDNPHNTFLRCLVDTGFIGLLAFGGMIFFSLANYWNSYKDIKDSWLQIVCLGFLGCMIAIITDALVHTFIGDRTLWFMIGLSFALRRMVIKKDERD